MEAATRVNTCQINLIDFETIFKSLVGNENLQLVDLG